MNPMACRRRTTLLASHLLTYDFLAPSFVQLSRPSRTRRELSTSQKMYIAAAPQATTSNHPSPTSNVSNGVASKQKYKKPLSHAQLKWLDSALRVNQTGELAATLIYKAQTPVVVNSHPHLRPLMKHMYDQEAGHFDVFNALLAKHRVRPTAMYPIWTIAASALGWGTAIMGREAAMACTEAVETEIGSHYNEQVRQLLYMTESMEKNGVEVTDEIKELTAVLRTIRDEELEHLDHAVANDAKEANPHGLLVDIIRAGCRGAIRISEKL